MDHPQKPSSENQEENQEKDSASTENLPTTNIEQLNQEQTGALQGLVGIVGGIGLVKIDKWDTERFFNKEKIDLKKLVEDKDYRRKIEEKIKKGKEIGKLKEQVQKAEQALSRVEDIDERLINTKTGLSNQYAIEAKKIYELNDEQLAKIKARAKKVVENDPHISMAQAMQQEAGREIHTKVETEVKNDKNINPRDQKKEIQRRLEERGKAFLEHEQTGKVQSVEKEQSEKIINSGKDSIKFTSSSILQEESIKQPVHPEPTTPQSAPVAKQVTSVPQTAPPLATPTATGPKTPSLQPSGGLSTGKVSGLRSLFNALKGGINGLVNRVRDGVKNAIELAKDVGALLAGGVPGLFRLGRRLGSELLRRLLGFDLNRYLRGFSLGNGFKYGLAVVGIIVGLLIFSLMSVGNTNLAAPNPNDPVFMQ